MSENFGSVVICDFEYEIASGDLPVVLCMVAYVLDENLRHVRTIRRWRGEFGPMPPFDIGPDTLFVAYSAWAEMTCFKGLGWPFPVHIYDQHTAYLAASNILLPYNPDEARKKPRKRLSDACRAYGIEGWERIDKETISKAIGDGTWHQHFSPQEVVDYCEEDVRMSARLLRAQLRVKTGGSVTQVLDWSNYSAKAVALIQARGMPIDMVLWNLVQENKAAVIAALIRQFDPSHGSPHPIYTPKANGTISASNNGWYTPASALGRASTAVSSMSTATPSASCITYLASKVYMHCVTASASSPRPDCRLAKTGEIGPHCFRSAPPPAVTRTPKARTTRTPPCARSCCFRRTQSVFIWTGVRRRLVWRRPSRAIKT